MDLSLSGVCYADNRQEGRRLYAHSNLHHEDVDIRIEVLVASYVNIIVETSDSLQTKTS